jgi:hypothetical protein
VALDFGQTVATEALGAAFTAVLVRVLSQLQSVCSKIERQQSMRVGTNPR